MGLDIEITGEELKVFLQEADEQLQLLDEHIVRLEKEADDADLLQEIFRAAHTLKGSSAMVGLDEMAELTHAVEDILDRLRKGTLTVTPQVVDALLRGLDGLKEMRENLGSEHGDAFDIHPVVDALRAVAEEEAGAVSTGLPKARTVEAAVAAEPAAAAKLQAAAEAGLSLFRVVVEIDEDTQWPADRVLQILTELSDRGEVIISVPSQQEIEDEQAGPELQAIIATPRTAGQLRPSIESVADVRSVTVEPWRRPGAMTVAEGAGAPQTVRIDVDRLDALADLVGELVIDRNRIRQIASTLHPRYEGDDLLTSLAETSMHVAKVVDELSESIMQVRMLPIGTLFSKFPRLVRDLARSTGKSVNFVLEGEETEIDRSVVEKIKDPLIHLIRNAVDHAIEPPETRRERGKPESGLVKLSAHHEHGHIVMTVADDGRGIDPDLIRESAVRKGIISREAAEGMSGAESLDLVFAAGVSTATDTTEVSGRGVGLDVVRREIEALNGFVQIDTSIGIGTTFTLRLPLTLATFRGLLMKSAKTTYAVPLGYVQETVRPEPGSIRTVMGRRVLNLRGNIMPLLRLSEICGTESENGRKSDDDFVVVMKVGDRPLAVGVDALVEQQEIVVKSLGGPVGQADGVAGASILGDGQVVLILDVPTLMKATGKGSPGWAEHERRAP